MRTAELARKVAVEPRQEFAKRLTDVRRASCRVNNVARREVAAPARRKTDQNGLY